MMEVDHISYIFGSFTRRRQSQDVSSAKRRSIEPAKYVHDRSKSAPHSGNSKNPSQNVELPSRARSICGQSESSIDEDNKYRCPKCSRHFLEPRVLHCLHTFCTKCLQELEFCYDPPAWNNGSDVSSTGNGSGGSGYVSDRQEASESASQMGRTIQCPICRARTDIPAEGILGLPPNFLIQHRMVLATLNAHTTKLLCDLCPNDVTATSRCTECAMSLCVKCADGHARQKKSHEVLGLDEARRRGITNVRRQVMCSVHPERELSIFCATCCQIVCRDCVNGLHRGHTHDVANRAAKSQMTNMRIALERAKSLAEEGSLNELEMVRTSERVEKRCDDMRGEIESFMEDYVRAVEEHRKNLHQQLLEARNEKQQLIDRSRDDLQRRLKDARDAVAFADELLREGTDVEVLSFVKPIMRRLEHCYKLDGGRDLSASGSLQFLPKEMATSDTCCPLYGVITAQTVSVKHCILHTNGLQNLRVGRRAEVILETHDVSDNPLQRGGEHVTAELRHRDAGVCRSLQIHVEDRRDGTYRICFIPDVAGKLRLFVYINDQPLKEGPLPILVKTLRPHHGTFHCCSFCSSGGSKEAACGCGGKMPGGYRGCGHGHEGHPGRRHWSCCGNVLEHSECIRSNSISHYQFTL
ncbi:PREDICTED: tripartite motif-containing protein 45 [Nicrophorus vespilloides]|uniref:Tripartite motif-containing protein 45 n=1 Tax=Nicrophorus vespilloides TaxID=110193 RepID=A0ABM1MRF5_NICVS|nr:PREDICTED: tripartite motif-containing protein 45 [Nicrophorus vespilloides]